MNVLTFPADSRPAQRIEGRIAALQRHKDHMSAVNILLAQGDLDGIRALGYDDDQLKAFMIPDSLGCIGFSVRSFTDIDFKIRQLKRGLEVPPITSAPGWDGRAPA